MSDTLKERLNRHSDAFEGLLSLIPAKYYYDEEMKDQWKQGKSKKGEPKPKKPKYDPEFGSSALDETKRRERALGGDADDDLEEEVIVYDDFGNEIPMDGKKKEAPILQLNGSVEESAQEASEETVLPEVATNGHAAKAALTQTSSPNGDVKAKSKESGKQKDSSEKSKGIQELRQKLVDRINEMRAKRKAPGTLSNGAPKSREELLESRKQRLEARKQKRKREETEIDLEEDEVDEVEPTVEEVKTSDPTDQIMFGKINFKDGDHLAENLEITKDKKLKKRDAATQLKVLENRKAKIEQLDEAKRKEVEEKAKWSKAILQAQGAKIKDSEKALKQTIKTKERRKKKSEKEWKERKHKVARDIAVREQKRFANLEARKLQKKPKRRGAVKKRPKKHAGFEGKK